MCWSTVKYEDYSKKTSVRRLCGSFPNYLGQLYLIVCADTDRCSYNNGGCSSLATCTNTYNGGRTCTCITGYTGDGFTCTGKIRLLLSASPLVPLQRSRPRCCLLGLSAVAVYTTLAPSALSICAIPRRHRRRRSRSSGNSERLYFFAKTLLLN